jgi:PKD repeat protein
VGTKLVRVDIQQLNTPSFSPPDTVCESDVAITLNGSPSGGTFSGPGVSGNKFDPDAVGTNTSHTITYTVTKGGCTKFTTRDVYVKDAPEPNLRSTGSSRLWQGLTTYYKCDTSSTTTNFNFYNQSFSLGYSSYTIDFGDGQSSTGSVFPNNVGTAISHAYLTEGLYTVTLTLHNSNGCSRSSKINVFFGRQPAIGFNIPGGAINQCIPDDNGYIEICVAITNVSANSPFTIYTLSSNDTTSNKVFTHPPPDTVCHRFYTGSCGVNSSKFTDAFELSLRASVPCIDRSATIEPIYISKPSVAAFLAPLKTCVNSQVTIQDNSVVGGVARPSGCLGSSAGRVLWEITPNTFTTPNGQQDLGGTFGSSDPQNWSSGASPLQITFTKSGVYTVKQIVGNALECTPDTVSVDICVDSIPVANMNLSADTVCVGQSISGSFVGEILGICDTMDILWRLPAPTSGQKTSALPYDTVQHFNFSRVGVYPIKMVAENSCDSVELFDTIVVRGIPTAQFPNDTAICGLATVDWASSHLQPLIFDSLSDITHSWSVLPASGWTFTGGTNSGSALPQINFTQYGTYQVVYTISSSCGSTTDTMVVSLTEKPKLQAAYIAFADTVVCEGTSLKYKASASLGAQPYQFSWGSWSQVGLSTADSIVLPNLTADTTIYVKVEDALGCSDSVAFKIQVAPAPVVNAGSTVSLCVVDSVQLSATVSGGAAPLTYQWSPPIGLSSTTALNPWRSPLDSTITYTLTVTDSLGCVYTDSVSVMVFPKPNFTAGNDFTWCVNQGDTVLNGAIPSGGSWSGTGLTGNLFSPIQAGLGTHTLVYTYTDPNNCTYQDSIAVNVIAQPSPNFGVNITQGCSPLTVAFTDSSGAPSGQQWFKNGILFSSAQNPVHTFFNTFPDRDTIIRIKLLFQAGSGCKDSIIKTITVFPTPATGFMLPSATCAGDSVQLINSTISKPGNTTYTWSASSPAIIISDTTAAAPTIIFPDFKGGTDSLYSICLVATSVDGCSDTVCQNILIRSRPQARFSLRAKACTPITINPTDSSSGTNLSYQWQIVPANNVVANGLNGNNPSFSFSSPAADSTTYNIGLMVTDAHGCVDSTSQSYTVYAQPAADFMVSRRDSCTPFTVNFTNRSSSGLSGAGQGLSYQWDLGNGNTSTDTNFSVTYINNGVADTTYSIRLIVQNSLGCTDTTFDSIVVHPNSVAQINFTDSVNCAPFTLDSNTVRALRYPFANAQYQWTIFNTNGGVVQTFNGANAINYSMNSGGDSVLVRLVATSLFGCKADTVSQLFYTIVNPKPNFVAVPDSICSGGTVLFQDGSSAGVTHEWFINETLFSTNANPALTLINTTFTRDSTVVIKLRIKAGSTGCADSISKDVVIHPAPDAQFSLPQRLCANDSVQLLNSSQFGGAAVYHWWVSSPAVNVSDTTAAQPWFHFPDNQSGVDSVYNIRLIVTNVFGCADTLLKTITINSRPVAAFGLPANGCGPVGIIPFNVTAGAGYSYLWSISPTTGVNTSGLSTSAPQFNFASPALNSARYSITLMLTDANGCIDTTTQSFDVYPKPTAGFAASNKDSCGPLTVRFSNTSSSNITGQNRQTMTFGWDFGNGQISQDSTPVITFVNNGVVDTSFAVRLIAANTLGCGDTIFDSITVRPNPLAQMDTSTTAGCAPFVINDSIVKAVVYPGANSGYQWSIINPQTQAVIQSFSGANGVNYAMLNSGDTVLIRLVTTSPYGCKSDTLEQLFRTIPNPEPGFTISAYTGCHPLTVNLTDTSKGVTTYAWYINGQLQSTTAPNPVFTLLNTSLTSDATYIIKLLGTAGSGCVDSIQDTVVVYALPSPSFTATEVCGGDTTTFTNTTFTIDSIVSWNWDFGDATTSTLKNPAHAYTGFGSYIVTLTATDTRGCSQLYTDTIIVRPNPVADFSASKSCGPDTACLGRPFSFTDLSTVATLGGTITQWQWDILNDGVIDYTVQNPQHTFTNSGVFSIKLIVQTQYGCRDSIVRQVQVLDAISANFFTDTTATCGPLNITATDSSTGPVTEYLWQLYTLDTLGNPLPAFYTSAQQNPNPIPTLLPSYLDDTTYVLKLTVSNCCDTVSHEQRFRLKPLPAAGVSVLPPSGCSGFKAQFVIDGNTTGRPDSVIMSFGDGTPVRIYTPSPVYYRGDTLWVFGKKSHVFINPTNKDTTYYVTLKAKNECGDSIIQIPILVHPNVVQAGFNYAPTQGCEDLTVSFNDRSFGGNTFAWCFDFDSLSTTGNHFTDSGRVATYTFTDPGIFVVAYIVSDGCSNDTAYTIITVFDAPETQFAYTNNVCEDDTAYFTDQTSWAPGTIGIYRWYFGDGDTSTLRHPAHVYDSAGVYTVWLKAFSPNGCVDSVSHQITIYDRPDVDFSVENVCLGNPLIFYDSTKVQNATIARTTWRIDSLGTFFSNPSPFTISKPGNYAVTLIKESSQGCVDSIIKTLSIYEVPKAGFSVKRDTTVDSCGNISAYVFRDSSISSTPLQYFWDFDLANAGTKTSNLKNPGSIVYTDTGYFYISLTVWNGDSCYDTFTDSLFVKPKSRVNFSPLAPEACMFDTIYFNDSTRYRRGSGNNVLTYLWDFGDGNTSTAKNPKHAYALAGTYTVKLKVWDPSCVDSLSRQVIIHQTPVAQIVANDYELCSRDEVEIFSSTLMNFPNGDVVDSLIWLVSDGRKIPSYQDSVVRIEFLQPGNYSVGLIAITDKGCSDTADAEVNVTAHPTPIVLLDEETINARTFRFLPDVTDAVNATHYWDFGNGDSRVSDKTDTISYRYSDRLCRIDSVIHHSVSLTVINQIENFGQCLDADTLQIVMEGYHLNVPNAFAPERSNVEDANVFLPKGKLLASYRLRVYDEWGNMVFENEELTPEGTPAVGWNGTLNGELLPTGAYVWTIDAEFNDGYVWPVKECNTDNKIKAYGTVTLIR